MKPKHWTQVVLRQSSTWTIGWTTLAVHKGKKVTLDEPKFPGVWIVMEVFKTGDPTPVGWKVGGLS